MKPYIVKYSLLIYSLLMVVTSFAQQSSDFQHLKISDAMNLALEQNKKLKIQTVKSKIATLNVEEVKDDRLPDVDFHTSYAILSNLNQFENGVTHKSTSYEVPREQYDFTLKAEVPIYEGGKLKLEDEQAKVDLEVEGLKTRQEERKVKLEVVTDYLQGLNLQRQQKLIFDKMHEDSAVIRQTEILKKNGAVTYNDVLRTKLQLSKHRMTASELEQEIAILEHKVKILLAIPEEVEMHINTDSLFTATNLMADMNQLVAEAYNSNETIGIAQKNAQSSEIAKKITKTNSLPKITAGGEYGYSYPNFMFFPPEAYLYRFGKVGVNLTMPLSGIFKNKVKVKRANQHIYLAKLQVEDQKDQLRHDVFAAEKRLVEADKKIAIAKEAIEQARENYRIVRLKYTNQLSLITELIDADNANLEAQSEYISLLIDKQLKYYQLDYVLGKL